MPSLGARLEYHVKVVQLGKLEGPLIGDFPLILHLALIANQVYTDVLIAVLSDLLEPLSQVHEGLIAGDVIDEEDAISASVEDAGHRTERLLTSLYLKLC